MKPEKLQTAPDFDEGSSQRLSTLPVGNFVYIHSLTHYAQKDLQIFLLQYQINGILLKWKLRLCEKETWYSNIAIVQWEVFKVIPMASAVLRHDD